MNCLENKWCWFVDGDEHFKVCESESEAHGEAKSHIDDNYEKGDSVTYTVGQACHPLDAILSESQLLWTGERVFEQVDEWCGEETGAEDFTMDITKEDKEALGKLVFDFLRKHAKVQWYGLAKGHREFEYKSGSED